MRYRCANCGIDVDTFTMSAECRPDLGRQHWPVTKVGDDPGPTLGTRGVFWDLDEQQEKNLKRRQANRKARQQAKQFQSDFRLLWGDNK